MVIYVITWSDGYDSGDCFVEAWDNEPDAVRRVDELNAQESSTQCGYSYLETCLNRPESYRGNEE